MTTSKKTSPKPSQTANKTATKSAKSASPSAAAPKVVSDYNGYDYKKIFWEDADRKYVRLK